MKTEEYIASLKQGLIDTQSALHECRKQLEETNRRKNIKIKELETSLEYLKQENSSWIKLYKKTEAENERLKKLDEVASYFLIGKAQEK